MVGATGGGAGSAAGGAADGTAVGPGGEIAIGAAGVAAGVAAGGTAGGTAVGAGGGVAGLLVGEPGTGPLVGTEANVTRRGLALTCKPHSMMTTPTKIKTAAEIFILQSNNCSYRDRVRLIIERADIHIFAFHLINFFCFHGLSTQIYEYGPPQLSIFRGPCYTGHKGNEVLWNNTTV